ncbi:secretin and TonB N-terminal domain-containing protein [Planctomycetota bacterium]
MILLLPAADALAAAKKVTVSQQNVSIAHVLKNIAEQASVQLVMTTGVDAIVSVNVKGQPWDEAIRQIAAKQGYHVWIEGNAVVVSKEKIGRQLSLDLVPEVGPAKLISLNFERISLATVLEKIATEVGINILMLPGKGEDLAAQKLPGRDVINVQIKDVHWRKALELVVRIAGCKVEAVADNVYVVKSLDIVVKAADRSVRDVIKDISDQSGINVVVSQKVQGTVTVSLDGVPWAEALDAIVTSLGLTWRQHGENTIIVSGETRKLETDVAFYNVSYLDGDKVAIAMKAIQGDEAKELGVEGLEAPWVLIINDKPHVLRKVEEFLRKYDRPAVSDSPLEFDLSKIEISIDNMGRYSANMPDQQKTLYYRRFKKVISPVMSDQGRATFLPIVDKVMVIDVPQNLTYVQEIAGRTFPPIRKPVITEKGGVGKDYEVLVVDPKKMARTLRAKVAADLQVEAFDNGVAVRTTMRQHKKVQRILKAYDTESVREEYSILYKTLDQIAPLLKQRLSALAVVETDALTRSIILEAPKPDHVYTEKFLKVQDVPEADAISVKVYKLKFAKADGLASIIQKFLKSTADLFEEEEEKIAVEGEDTAEGAKELEGAAAPDKPEKEEDEAEGTESAVPTSVSTLVGKIEAVVLADVASNSLIVTARGEDMPKIQDLIERLDDEPKQVLVLGRIVETTMTDFSDIGIDWHIAGTISGASLPTSFPFNKRNQKWSQELVPDKNPGETGITDEDLYPPNQLFAYGEEDSFKNFGTLSMAQLSVTLAFLESSRDTKLISTPRLVILDNTTASFLVTETREYRKRGQVTEGDGGQIAFEYEYANAEEKISMEVTPQITPNDKVLLSLKPEVTSFVEFDEIANPDGTTDKLPVQVQRTAETKVIVGDGMTLVLAGLVRDWGRNADNRVPFLGRVPVLGRLFSKEIKEKTQRNLLFFFTPIIMRDDESHELRAANVRAAYEAPDKPEAAEIVRWDKKRKLSRRDEIGIASQRPLDTIEQPSGGERR